MFPAPRLARRIQDMRGVMRQISNSSVLIVDQLEESREVLRTALERRGMRVLEATQLSDGLVMARLHRPDLIVLDLEAATAGIETAEEFASVAENDGGMLLILGNLQFSAVSAGGEFMAKPYHYKPLILRIEELLRRRCSRAAA
jgi:DNA-binding response OmpR family regulator